MPGVLSGAPIYLGHFALREAPFSATPDQRFLYLTERHRDGFAHLLYGVAERGGFVQLTGEVGTGKTTLCRYLLEHLPGHVDVALILNPVVSRIELLETICDELRVTCATPGSVKALIDALYNHLLDAHARGRRTVVIVDEAQHLSVELLEQLRLLTNLETAKAKLLQIILVGQPELIELLSRNDLRQVAQRVAARYHLTPLVEGETRAYVAHRLSVAGQTRPLFDDRAVRAVHRASKGVPRLINILCDRAMLGAYASRKDRVTRDIVRRAVREVAGETPRRRSRARRLAPVAAGVALAVALGTALLTGTPLKLFAWALHGVGAAADRGVGQAAVAAPSAPEKRAEAAVETPVSLGALLDTGVLATDAHTAFASAVAAWGRRYDRHGDESPCVAVRRAGLDCIARRGTLNLVRRLDLPAVLELRSPAGTRHFLAVTSVSATAVSLQAGPKPQIVPINEIEREWDGSFVVLWKPPRMGIVPIGPTMSGADVAWLRERLGALDGDPIPAVASPRTYDEPLAARIAAFQRAQRLIPDGIAGEETLARLTAMLDPATPSLRGTRGQP
jgi:general secretion pathway protein A